MLGKLRTMRENYRAGARKGFIEAREARNAKRIAAGLEPIPYPASFFKREGGSK